MHERSSEWSRYSFKEDFLLDETILLMALFATPFLNEDGFGGSFRHSWEKVMRRLQGSNNASWELNHFFPERQAPQHLKPDETTQHFTSQEQ
jgi:hypothetical protein